MAGNVLEELKARYDGRDAPAWVWDPDFKRIVWGNAAAAVFWGEPSRATLPDKWFDTTGDTATAFSAIAVGSTEGGLSRSHIPLFYQGAVAKIACEITPIDLIDGRRGVFVAPIMPIQIAQVGLNDSLDITDVLPQVIATFTTDGRLLHQNAIAKDIFGTFTSPASEVAPVALSYWLGGEHIARRFINTVMTGSAHSILQEVQTRFGRRLYRIHAKRLSQTSPESPAFVVTFMDAGVLPSEAKDEADEDTGVSSYKPSIVELVSPVDTKLEAPLPEAQIAEEAEPPAEIKPDFTWKMDARSRLVEISSGIAEIIGIPPQELMGRTWINVSDRYGLDFDGKIDRLIDARLPWRETVIWPTNLNGVLGAVTVEFTAQPIKTAAGKFAGFEGVGRAVDMVVPAKPTVEVSLSETTGDTPSVRSASALTADEQRTFRELGKKLARTDRAAAVVDTAISTPQPEAGAASPDLISALEIALDEAPLSYLIHRNFHILYANTSAADLFGFETADALVSDPNLLNLFPEERGSLFEWQSAFDDEISGVGKAVRSLGLIGKKANQTKVKIDATLAPIPLEDGFAVQMVLSEPSIDAAKLSEAQSREAELRTILDTATDGIATLDEEGRIVTLNKSAEAIFGLDLNEVVGRKFVNLLVEKSALVVEDYLSGLSDNSLATIFNDGREIVAVESNGGFIPLFLTIGLMPDEIPSKFCAVMRDITQWKKSEENLKQAKDVAEKASTQKSEFLAKISHELRTPLNSIIGFSEVMAQERFGTIKNDRYKGYINDIHSSGKHLLSLINDLLDLSKVEAGKLEMEFTSVSLNDIILKSVSSLQNDASRERIVIRNFLATDLPNVVADERSCRQIILNLLSNAIKFTKAGGQVIVSSSLEESGEVKISVRDTGVGMSEKDIAHALEPFRQITTSSTGSTVGTGLGLPLTKALTEANRARFRIESKPKSGTLVEITFPTARVLAD